MFSLKSLKGLYVRTLKLLGMSPLNYEQHPECATNMPDIHDYCASLLLRYSKEDGSEAMKKFVVYQVDTVKKKNNPQHEYTVAHVRYTDHVHGVRVTDTFCLSFERGRGEIDKNLARLLVISDPNGRMSQFPEPANTSEDAPTQPPTQSASTINVSSSATDDTTSTDSEHTDTLSQFIKPATSPDIAPEEDTSIPLPPLQPVSYPPPQPAIETPITKATRKPFPVSRGGFHGAVSKSTKVISSSAVKVSNPITESSASVSVASISARDCSSGSMFGVHRARDTVMLLKKKDKQDKEDVTFRLRTDFQQYDTTSTSTAPFSLTLFDFAIAALTINEMFPGYQLTSHNCYYFAAGIDAVLEEVYKARVHEVPGTQNFLFQEGGLLGKFRTCEKGINQIGDRYKMILAEWRLTVEQGEASRQEMRQAKANLKAAEAREKLLLAKLAAYEQTVGPAPLV